MSRLAPPHWMLVAALVSAGVVVGCGTHASNAGDAALGAPDAGVDVVITPAVKAPLLGLIDMQTIAWHNTDTGEPTFNATNVATFPGLFGGIVINATWRALQPAGGGALDTVTVDGALEQVRAYNAANPAAPLGVKLRVFAGNSAPAWAKALAGGPVTIFRNPAGCQSPPCPLTVGLYWSDAYIAAWRAFQALLAARYDGEPLIRQVAVTSCAAQTDEPFVPSNDAQARANLIAAGYTDAAQQACLLGAVDDYASWKLTLVDYTFNTFYLIGGGNDPTVAPAVMEACRSAFRDRCVLDNHALSAPLRAQDTAVYDAIQALGPPIDFQTDSPQNMNCQWTATVAEGVALGGAAIEMWPDAKFQGFDTLSAADVAQLASEFVTPIPVLAPTAQPSPCSGFH
jgi:hypothetical protein